MKRAVILAAMMAMLTVAAAFGAVQDFGKFTVDVAEGWKTDQYYETVSITKYDETASMSLMMDSRRGKSAKQLMNFYIENFRGGFAEITEPKKFEDSGYHWMMTGLNGERSYVMFDVYGRDYMLIIMTGLEAAPEEMSAMLRSVNVK